MANRYLRGVRAFFTEDVTLKLLAVLLGALTFYTIRGATSFEVPYNIPVQVKVGPGIAILDQSVRSVDVTFRGSQEDLRRRMAIVLQDVFLFAGTIAENIRLGNAAISDEQVRQAATYVNANGFIERLPKDYDSEVLERGATLSTGQKQLLAFARAVAFDPDLLILDEATANIDTETEALIQDALAKLMRDRTCIVVAHRLSTIQSADRIAVFSHGRIHEEGTHQELLRRDGLYRNLYELQYQS